MYTTEERAVLDKAVRNPTLMQRFVMDNRGFADALNALLRGGGEMIKLSLTRGEGYEELATEIARAANVRVEQADTNAGLQLSYGDRRLLVIWADV
jgi:hypothetical protein